MRLKRVRCNIIGHQWRYNHPTMPTQAICKNCYTKEKLNTSKLEWESVSFFNWEQRTDEQLSRMWFKEKY